MFGFSPLSSFPFSTPSSSQEDSFLYGPIGTGVGKISGPLLAPNLERSGTDWSVDTDLLYLNVNDQRIGFATDVPDATLSINNNFVADDMIIDDLGNIGDLQYVGSGLNEIRSFIGNINILPSGGDPVIQATAWGSQNVVFDDNIIRSEDSNTSIEFYVDPSRKINIHSNVLATGGLHASGDITFDGNIQLGNDTTDSIAFFGELNTNIIPDSNLTYNLGSASKKWGSTYFYLWNGAVINATEIVSGGVGFGARQGNSWYVAKGGNDTNVGDHPNGPFLSIGEAINHAVAGDTIFIYPGEYEEALPLTVPTGVTIQGLDLRNVIIKPDSSTAEDVFLLNGECTIENITIKDFHFDALNNRGYAFRFAPGMTVTTRSPYIRNITVITSGTVTSLSDPRGYDTGDAGRGAYIDGSVVNAASKEASMLFHSTTFICPGSYTIIATNGVRVEWLNSFIYFASVGMSAVSDPIGFAGDGKTRLRVYGMSASTVVAGDTITLLDSGSTLVSAVIESITYDMPTAYIVIDGKIEGWETSLPPPDSSVQQDIEFSSAASLSFSGSNYLSLSAAQTIGTQAFTFECFFYTASNGLQTLLGASSAGGMSIWLFGDGINPVTIIQIDRSYVDAAQYTVSPITINTWHHIAVTRDSSNNMSVFLDGVKATGSTSNTADYTGSSGFIGSVWSSPYFFTGYLTQIKLTVGSNYYNPTASSISVPTTSLTSSANTKLLLTVANNGAYLTDTSGTQTISNTGGVAFNTLGPFSIQTATHIVTADYSDFGAEIRVISSANVYGDYGIIANGVGTLIYLINHNFSYIGSGKIANNDPADVIQANEVVAINGGDVHYQSQDHAGNFRVGEILTIDQHTGNIFLNFTFAEFVAGSNLTITSGNATTIIDATQIQTGVLRFISNGINNIETGGTTAARSINISPGVFGKVNISHYTALELSKGGDVNLTLSTLGEIRFNNVYNDFEGFSSQGKNNLYSIWDNDRDTYITPELTPGANDNTLRFVANSVLQSYINSTGIYSNKMTVSSLTIDGNTISSNESNSDIELIPNAYGVVIIDNIQIYDEKIEVDTFSTNLIINGNSGFGYVKFGGQGSVIPAGNIANRPLVVEQGMIRYNTDTPELEVYTGNPLLGSNGWIPSAGITGVTITPEIMDEFSTIWGLTLG